MPQGSTAPGKPRSWLQDFLLDPGEGCRLDWPFAVNRHGYPTINLGSGGRTVAHAVCLAVHGPRPTPASVARHGECNDRMCIQPDHLSWGTYRENETDKLRDDKHLRGSRNHQARLGESQVLEVVDLLRSGQTQQQVADRFGVGKTTISAIARGQNWSWLTGF